MGYFEFEVHMNKHFKSGHYVHLSAGACISSVYTCIEIMDNSKLFKKFYYKFY